MVETLFRLTHDPGNDPALPLSRTLIKSHRFINRPAQCVGVIVAKDYTVTATAVRREHIHRIMQAAGIMHHRERTVILAGHLRQTAGFKPGGHQHKVGGGKAKTRQMFIEITHRHPVVEVVERDDIFENLLILTIGDNGDSPDLARTNLLRIADSATATALAVNVGGNSSHAVLEVNGGKLVTSGKVSVGASGNEATSNCVVRIVDGTLNYGTIYLYCDGNSLDFSNATVSGTRIEMTRSSSIQLFNTHLTIPSGIFMMGDANGSDAANNALKRDIYVGGTDTWVKVTASNGLWVRGSNTTMRVHVPAEGFSTSHPVFDLNKIVYGSDAHRLRVEITAEEPVEQADGVWYTLFKCSGFSDSAYADQLEWVVPDSDKVSVKIDKSVGNEVRIRVNRKHGLMIILK